MKRLSNIVWIAFAVCLSACIKEEPNINYDPDTTKTQIALSFEIPTEIKTYGIASQDECRIVDLYVLVFNSRTNTYVNGEKINSSEIISSGEDKPTISTRLPITKGDKVVVLVNSGATFESKDIPLTAWVSTTQDINTAFPFDNITQSLQENINRGIPMSGTIVFGTDTVCKITRSVARIQVEFADKVDVAPGIDGFSESSAEQVWWLANYPKSGAIFNETSSTSIVMPEKVSYVVWSSERKLFTCSKEPFNKKILYIPEFKSSTLAKGTTITKNTFSPARLSLELRVQGKYYRIDLVKKAPDGSFEYIDIQRNHNYRIIIKSVKMGGYSDWYGAMLSPGSNLECEIKVDGANDNVVTSNGRFAVALECDEIVALLPEAKRDFTVKARIVNGMGEKQPYPDTITCSQGVTLTGINMLTNKEQEIKFNMVKGTTSGTVTVTVGNIVKTINISCEKELSGKGEQRVINGDFSMIRWDRCNENLTVTLNGTSSMTVKCNANSGSAPGLKGVAYNKRDLNLTKLIIYQGGV